MDTGALAQGRAVVINPTATPPAEIVHIWPPSIGEPTLR